MESVGLISVLRVLRGMKVPEVTAIKWVTRPLFIVDMAAKRRKKHKNKISGLIISMGYETEIQEF